LRTAGACTSASFGHSSEAATATARISAITPSDTPIGTGYTSETSIFAPTITSTTLSPSFR